MRCSTRRRHPVCRHTPATLARAAQARTLRDVECLEWQQVGERLGCSAATAMYLYRATPDAVLEDDLARADRALYLTATMTGLRQGELLGLRWRDVDWTAQRVRVRQTWGRGEFPSTGKSDLSTRRSLPMADRLVAELDAWSKRSRFTNDDDLVFAHPVLGVPLDGSKVSK